MSDLHQNPVDSHHLQAVLVHQHGSLDSDPERQIGAEKSHRAPGGPGVSTDSGNDRVDPDSKAAATHSSHRKRRFQITRTKTDLHDVEIADRGFSHKYIIRKPRALQYIYNGKLVKLSSKMDQVDPSTPGYVEGANLRSTDSAASQRGRLDLFVDLIWVGVIGNLAENYSRLAFESEKEGVQYSDAILAYFVCFVPAWKIWNSVSPKRPFQRERTDQMAEQLRDFLNHFYSDDFVQRLFVVWILIIMLVFGNTAFYIISANEEGIVVSSGAKLVVILYLTARGTFILMETLYSLAIPWLRKLVLAQWVLVLPTAALWIGGLFVSWPHQAGFLIAASLLDLILATILASPASDILLGKGYRIAHDEDHLIDRIGTFYVIILGAGVFLLINGSPAGATITAKTGTAIEALVCFYALNWIYFNAAQDVKFVPAVKRVWWRKASWLSAHVSLFGSLLIFGSSLKFLVVHDEAYLTHAEPEPGLARRAQDEVTAHALLTARWSISITLSVALACMTGLALLNRPLDGPRTLIVNNRYLRLVMRPVAMAIMLGLSGYDKLSSSSFIGVVLGCLWAVLGYETIVGRIRGGGLWEPWGRRQIE
ncbi:MAG: hypothetical protein M1814_006392 [Vezdaea aestivalis]|nr:MAG: hypothetical protein M1814_006392 [Vezdaea aestivalis]